MDLEWLWVIGRRGGLGLIEGIRLCIYAWLVFVVIGIHVNGLPSTVQ